MDESRRRKINLKVFDAGRHAFSYNKDYITGTEEELKAIKMDPTFIQHVNNPSEEMQIRAVTVKASTFVLLKNPCDEAIKIALQRNPLAVARSIYVNEKIKLEAIKSNGYIIRDINNPSEEMQIEAVKQSGSFIKFITCATETVQELAIEDDESNYVFIKNPSYAITLKMAELDPNLIKNNDTCIIDEKIAIKMIQTDISCLHNIPHRIITEKVELEIVKIDGMLIKFMNHPSERVQEAAVRQNAEAVHYIHNPSEKLSFMTM